jgi:hypothetical protein
MLCLKTEGIIFSANAPEVAHTQTFESGLFDRPSATLKFHFVDDVAAHGATSE